MAGKTPLCKVFYGLGVKGLGYASGIGFRVWDLGFSVGLLLRNLN